MATLRTKLAARFVRLLGIKRRLRQLAAVDDDPEAFARLLTKIRRTDRVEPPRRIRRAWGHERVDVDGFALHVLTNLRRRSERLILYLHGGGYMFGPFGTEWAAVSKVAGATGCDFAVLVYPKAPEYEAPFTIAVTRHAFDELAARYEARNLVLMGTSAGGALAVVLMAELRDRGEALPAQAVLLSPGVDVALEDDVGHMEGGDVLLSADHVQSVGKLYAGAWGPRHPKVSPTFADLARLPPLHVFAGTREILFQSLATFVERATAAGTAAHLVVGDDQQHTWPASPTPEGREALAQIVEIVGTAPSR